MDNSHHALLEDELQQLPSQQKPSTAIPTLKEAGMFQRWRHKLRNGRNACICGGVAVIFLVVVPSIIFVAILVHSRKVQACQEGSGRMINGGFPDGTTVCT